MSKITSYCRITDEGCFIDGQLQQSYNADAPGSWLKQIYKSLELDYPKFFKMDLLAKYAFIASELLKKHGIKTEEYGDDDIALFFANSEASSYTDKQFHASYTEENNPRPGLFVYTLPNILIGEISIRNKWYGENLFAITSEFDAKFFVDNCQMTFNRTSKAALCGWVNVDGENPEVFLFFVEQAESGMEMTTDNLNKIFTTI